MPPLKRVRFGHGNESERDAVSYLTICRFGFCNTTQQRWLWYAIDHKTGQVLAYVLSNHQDKAFLELKALLEPFGIMQFYTDDWGTYQRHLDPAFHTVGKAYTQTIERKHLTLRTRLKRLARKTICFSLVSMAA